MDDTDQPFVNLQNILQRVVGSPAQVRKLNPWCEIALI